MAGARLRGPRRLHRHRRGACGWRRVEQVGRGYQDRAALCIVAERLANAGGAPLLFAPPRGGWCARPLAYCRGGQAARPAASLRPWQPVPRGYGAESPGSLLVRQTKGAHQPEARGCAGGKTNSTATSAGDSQQRGASAPACSARPTGAVAPRGLATGPPAAGGGLGRPLRSPAGRQLGSASPFERPRGASEADNTEAAPASPERSAMGALTQMRGGGFPPWVGGSGSCLAPLECSDCLGRPPHPQGRYGDAPPQTGSTIAP